MTEHRAPLQGLPRSRHRSPGFDVYPHHHQALLSPEPRITPPGLRKRPVRTVLAIDETSPSTPPISWFGSDEDDSGQVGGRTVPHKYTELNNTTPDVPIDGQKKNTPHIIPRHSHIRPGKEPKTVRHRGSSIVSSAKSSSPIHRRHRHVEDAALSPRPTKQKHLSLKNGVESIGNLPNSSLISVLSGDTKLSSLSSDSNATITQELYDKTHTKKNKSSQVRKGQVLPFTLEQLATMGRPRRGRTLPSRKQRRNPEQVFPSQQSSPPLTASSVTPREPEVTSDSGGDSDGDSSVADRPTVESPFTSPASMKRSSYTGTREEDSDSEAGISVREASPELLHQPRLSDEAEESQTLLPQEDEDEEESSEEESEHADPSVGGSTDPNQQDRRQHHRPTQDMALERMPPPPAPSSPPREDRYTRRLRQQEQAVSEHMLQSPQPQRDFRFAGGPSPHRDYAMPVYDPYAQSAAPPTHSHAVAQNAPAPMYPMNYFSPPQVPIAPYSPGYDRDSAMVARPPMTAANVVPPVAAPPPFPYPPAHPPLCQPHPQGPDWGKPTVVGYELLAEKLSESSRRGDDGPRSSSSSERPVVPLYRKFEHLNHRVLLHIQDEIAEMEEELRHLDECIAQSSPRDEAGRVQPASRRGETRYGSELHYRRTELLGRIYLKLGQYNSAMSSFTKLLRDLSPAEAADIKAYRTWMEKRAPIDHGEMRFLELKDDLLAVSRKGGTSTSAAGGAPNHETAVIWLPMILAMPLLAFAIVPGLLGRLVILCLQGAAVMRLLTSTRELRELKELMTVREWMGCLSIYFGVMFFAALAH